MGFFYWPNVYKVVGIILKRECCGGNADVAM